ncbi:vomeronasal type-1 receptor 4-like [Erinaceus europaeus]|uniref:Vomeronasal type-1 receptor n=1 Tax=Erinaceus europaeus TaxID=9365 RepID=A0ABM3VRZ5_ERIEU|nr:vomeronasal type-1 receptor 4-like [Erinaceus europaeus]
MAPDGVTSRSHTHHGSFGGDRLPQCLGCKLVFYLHRVGRGVSMGTTCLLISDVMSLGLMTWASGSMVSMLHRHKQQVKHLHRARVTPRTAPETRASKSILVLVSTFVTCYALSSTCHLCIALSKHPSWLVLNFSALLAASFPTVSPLLLMSCRSRLYGPCHVCVKNTNPQYS